VINGILYVLITGCRWMDMPICCGLYKTAWKRLKRWRAEGVWDRVFKELASVRSHDRVAVDSPTLKAKKRGAYAMMIIKKNKNLCFSIAFL